MNNLEMIRKQIKKKQSLKKAQLVNLQKAQTAFCCKAS